MTLRLTCTTCRARLKVVDPSAIGQIVSCPKCGSMVEVAAPPGGLDDAKAASGKLAPLIAAGPAADSLASISPAAEADAAGAASSRWFWPTFGGVTLLALAAAAVVIYIDRAHHKPQPDEVAQMPLFPPSSPPAAADPVAASDPTAKTAPAADPPPKKSPVDSNSGPIADPKSIATAHADAAPHVATAPADTKPGAEKMLPPEKQPAGKTPSGDEKTAKAPSPVLPAAAGKPPLNLRRDAIASRPAAPVPAGPTIERIPPRNVDVEARLADRLRGIEFPETPLFQFLAELSQMSTIPISLDADALAEMGVAADAPVSLALKETTVGGALKEAISAHALGYRVVDHQLVVGRPASDGLRSVRYSVADLTGDGAQRRQQFATLVQAMVEPQSWQKAGGSGTAQWSEGALLVEQDDAVHARLLAFCEKLRVARGLPLQSRSGADRFQLTPRTVQAQAMLQKRVTLQFARPEPLAHILDHLRTTTHCNILVDGPALADERTSVETEGVAVAKNQPLGQALANLLDPLELTCRAVDSRTVLITTQHAAARHAEVEFYPVRELLISDGPGDALAERLGRELAAIGPGDPPAAAPVIRFDAPSRSLIVRAPQSAQVRVQSLLEDWRSAPR